MMFESPTTPNRQRPKQILSVWAGIPLKQEDTCRTSHTTAKCQAPVWTSKHVYKSTHLTMGWSVYMFLPRPAHSSSRDVHLGMSHVLAGSVIHCQPLSVGFNALCHPRLKRDSFGESFWFFDPCRPDEFEFSFILDKVRFTSLHTGTPP